MKGNCYVLVMDSGRQACQLRICDQLPSLLPKWFQPYEIALTVTASPGISELGVPIKLVVVRISDLQPRQELCQMIGEIRRQHRKACVLGLFCTKQIDCTYIRDSLNTGFDDYICCPFREIDLFPRLHKILRTHENAVDEKAPSIRPFCEFRHNSLVGSSTCFIDKVNLVPRLASSDATLLITGETGTGKELFAQAIHSQSNRKSKPFIAVNCSALPDQLFENELFGHMKGAYTNAFTSQRGLVAEAEGGTLLLDEVDSLSSLAQTKLLRFLQDRQYRPLGSSSSLIANVRIISATNADLEQRIATRQFREDLFYRLKVLSLRIPPLRERCEDIPILALHFLSAHGRNNGNAHEGLRLSSAATEKLMNYDWPGNVRELEGTIQRAVFLAQGGSVGAEAIELSSSSVEQVAIQGGALKQAKFTAIRTFERAYLSKLLAQAQGNVTRAAKLAGKDRRAMQRLLQKHKLDRSTFGSDDTSWTVF